MKVPVSLYSDEHCAVVFLLIFVNLLKEKKKHLVLHLFLLLNINAFHIFICFYFCEFSACVFVSFYNKTIYFLTDF